MSFDPVLLLSVLAVFLMVFFPLLGKNRTIPKALRDSRRRKLLIGQLAVLVLFVATFVTLRLPINGMHSLIQGVLLSSIVLVPAFVLHLLASLYYGLANSIFTNAGSEARHLPGEDGFTKDSKKGKKQPRIAKLHKVSKFKNIANAQMVDVTDNIPVMHVVADRRISDDVGRSKDSIKPKIQQAVAPAINPPKNAAVLGEIPRSYHDVVSNSERDVEAQIDGVSQCVQSHDLGGQDTDSLRTESISELPLKKNSAPTPQFSGKVPMVGGSTNLETMDISEMCGLLSSLQIDNGQLQKLVIAQHAVIESLRESHDRSKVAVRDAVKIMKNAQNNQKVAEKIARRKKTERQCIQNE